MSLMHQYRAQMAHPYLTLLPQPAPRRRRLRVRPLLIGVGCLVLLPLVALSGWYWLLQIAVGWPLLLTFVGCWVAGSGA